MWTSAWQRYRYGDGCGESVCVCGGGGLGGAVFTLSQHAFLSDREWSGQPRRRENAQMVTKSTAWTASENILSVGRRIHVLGDTRSAARRLYVIIPPRALSDTGTSDMILLYILWTLDVRIHSDSQFKIKNSVAFPFPRVTFVSSPNTEVVVHCPAHCFFPPLGEKLSPPYAARIPSMGKCFHNALTSCTVGAHTSCNSHTLSGYRYFVVKSVVG